MHVEVKCSALATVIVPADCNLFLEAKYYVGEQFPVHLSSVQNGCMFENSNTVWNEMYILVSVYMSCIAEARS